MNFSIVVPSASPGNLISCLKSLYLRESSLKPENIIVIDDGLGSETRKLFPRVRWIDGIKPFVYSRNVNLGLRAAGTDVMLIGDDTLLESHEGFSTLSKLVRLREDIGICSPGIVGMAHPWQAPQPGPKIRVVDKNLAFVAVYIKRTAVNAVGLFDERFVGYGYDDDDYCTRVRNAGLHIGVYDGCVVTHRVEMSKFRKIPNEKFMKMYRDNEKLYREKWGIK